MVGLVWLTRLAWTKGIFAPNKNFKFKFNRNCPGMIREQLFCHVDPCKLNNKIYACSGKLGREGEANKFWSWDGDKEHRTGVPSRNRERRIWTGFPRLLERKKTKFPAQLTISSRELPAWFREGSHTKYTHTKQSRLKSPKSLSEHFSMC